MYFNNFVSFKDPLVPEIARQYKQDREGYNAVNKKQYEIIFEFIYDYLDCETMGTKICYVILLLLDLFCRIYYSEPQ